MVKTLELANGMFVSMAVAEVTSVPFYELFAKDLDRANYSNQVLFTQILQAMHRKSDAENTAFEFLFQSIGVDNQTYKAQVRLYIIVRKIGDVKFSNESFILDMMSSIKNDLEDKTSQYLCLTLRKNTPRLKRHSQRLIVPRCFLFQRKKK